MIYYYFLILLVLTLSLLAKQSDLKNISLWMIVIAIFVFFAYRVGFTPDYYNYESYFDGNEILLLRHLQTEPLFVLMVNTFPNYRWMLIFQTILYCIVIYIVFKNNIDKKYWWFAFIFLFFVSPGIRGNISGLRSCFVSIAFMICLLVKDKSLISKILAILFMVAAALIHRSGWFILPLLFISSKLINKTFRKIVLAFLVVLIFISLFAAKLIGSWLETITIIAGFGDDVEEYFQNDVHNTFYLGVGTILRISAIMFLFLVSFSNINNKNLTSIETISVKLMAIFFLLNLMPSVGLIERFYSYLVFPCLIGGSAVLKYEPRKEIRTCFMILFILYGFWDIYFMRFSFFFNDTWRIYHNTLVSLN